ncbi:glycosyltransferase, partial [Candidatus Roizmanbacteria bacterium]|nr:glycosyltransferase [Candidatus Roizmanbacteria bacterium]
MYKIGIDARLYNQTGVGVYLRNLLYYLERLTKNYSQFFIYLTPDVYDKVRFKSKYFVKQLVDYRWHTFAEQTGFAKKLYQDNLDLVHFTYFSYPILYKKKFIATIHDTTPLFFKTGKASTKNPFLYEIKFRAFQFVISQEVKNAVKIITPSNTVKNQLVELYGKSYENKIESIYEGVDYELINQSNSRESGNQIKSGLLIKSGMTKK